MATPSPTAVKPTQKETRILPILGLVFGGISGATLCWKCERIDGKARLMMEKSKGEEVTSF